MTDAVEVNSRSPKMLIADDDPAIVKLLADRFGSMGFDVETATNGLQALVMAHRGQHDILVIDVNMPEVDGLSVCTRLLDPKKKAIDVVVVTGSRDQETIQRCESMGAYYTRKGPDFWNHMASALMEIFPGMLDKINDLKMQSVRSEIRMRPRVLLVDDDADVQRHLFSRLGKYGVDLLYAPNAVHGYRMACREDPCVIICDNFMPDGDALYLLGRLRTTPSTENIPFLVWSGRKLDELTVQGLTREICGRPGAVQVLRKSSNSEELFTALQKFCGFEKCR